METSYNLNSDLGVARLANYIFFLEKITIVLVRLVIVQVLAHRFVKC